MRKLFSMKHFLTVVFACCVTIANAQTISGPTSVYTNAVYTYTYNNSTVYADGYFDAVNGTVLTNTLNGTIYTTTISWNAAGSGTVKFYNGPTVLKTLSVTITYAPPTPNATTTTAYSCSSTTVTRSTTPPSGTDWYWQTSSSGTSTSLGNGSSVNITTNGTTLYLRARQQASPNTWSVSSQSIGTITVYTTIPGAPSTNTAISTCGPSALTLTATPGTNGNQVKWYAASTGGTSLATGNYSVSVSTTTTYYVVSVISTSGCESTPRTAVTVTVNSVPSLNSFSGSNLCGSSGSATFHAAVDPGNGVKWYNNSTGGSYFATGTSYTATITSSTTYYATAYNTTTGCETATRTAVTSTLNAYPSASAPNQTICSGTTSSVNIAGPTGTTYTWTASPSGTVTGYSNGSGASIAQTLTSTGTANTSVTYSITPTNNGCTGSVSTVTVTVNPAPVSSAANQSVCSGLSTSITPAANLSGTTYSWTVVQSGTSGASASSGATIVQALTATSSSAGTATYSITPTYNGCNGSVFSAVATVNPIPAAPAVAGTERFGAGTLALVASGAPTGGSYQWYDATNALQSSTNSWTTPSVSANTSNYGYAKVTSSANCVSLPTWASITIYAIPVITASQTYTVRGSSVTLDAGAGYDSYIWKNGSGATVFLSNSAPLISTYGATAADTYSVVVTKGGATSSPVYYTLASQFASVNINYVVTNTVLADSITDAASVVNLPIKKASQVVQYFDGLGRTIQTISTQASPLKNDIVQPNVYDVVGREFRKYLPVTGEANGRYKSGLLDRYNHYAGIGLNYYNNGLTDKIADDTVYYHETIYEPSPLNRPLTDYGSGSNWRVNNKGIAHQYLVNNASQEQIIAWQLDATTSLPVRSSISNGYVSGTYYTGGQLLIKSTKDENGNEVREYTDKLGHVILKKVQLATGSPSLNDPTSWTQTYYIYDDLGKLRYVLQPELSKTVVQQGTTYKPTKTDLDKFAFQYQYDSYGRMAIKKVPGAGCVYMVYDNMDRLVMTQDSIQRVNMQWLVTKYDTLNRPVITAIYSPGSAITLKAVNTMISQNRFCEYYVGTPASSNYGYTNNVFPTTNLTVLTVTFYDNYKFISDLSLSSGTYNYLNTEIAADNANGLPAQETSNFANIKGHVSGTMVNLLGTTKYLVGITYYDYHFHMIQTIADNNKGGWDRTTYVVDFTGRVLKTKTTHHTSTHSDQTMVRRFVYDHMSRVKQVYYALNANSEILLVQNSYNEIGQLVTKSLYSTNNGTSFTQNADYRYNIRGWMQSMNNSQLVDDHTTTNTNSDTNDLFGFELAYNTPFTTGNSTSNAYQWNGNISSMKWSSNHGTFQTGFGPDVAYNYSYDALNRISGANYMSNTSSVWSNATNAFSESGYTYDMNGNIKGLLRNNNLGSVMDNMTYTYNGNQLLGVSDAGDKTKGFIDGANTGNDYTYDVNGNMVLDNNKTIDSIKYNHLNLPIRVKKHTGEFIKYTYDATGRKLKQDVYNASGSITKTTDYDGEFIYQGDTLQFVNHEEGRIVMKLAPNTANSTALNEYQYHLKDHLGNVRLTFTTKAQTTASYVAHFENPAAETSSFSNYQTTSAYINTDLPTAPSPSWTSPYSSYHLNGGYTGQVGLAKSFSVMPGDVVSIQATAKFNPNQNGATTSYTQFVTSLLSAFNLSAPAPGETGTPAAGVNTFGNWEIGSTGDESHHDTYEVFVTIFLFDRNYNLLDVAYDHSTASGAQMNRSYTVKQPGYAYLYISNEHPTQMDVYFDDVTMNFTPSAVQETTDYYPFGLVAQNFQRQGEVPQNFKYNGKEQINDLNLDWADYGARMYMPEIGRWGVVDPKSEKYYDYSTYNYAINNPILFIDPNGEDLFLFYYLSNNNHGGEEDKKSNAMFWASAITRAMDMAKNGEIKEGDKYIIKGVDNMSNLKSTIEGDVAANKEQFGKTKEVGLWSHGGLDGPFRDNADGSHDQLSVKGWGDIDFNWKDSGAKFGVYGCRSGKDPDESESRRNDGHDENSFVQNVSGLANMKNVEVWGQTQKSWPSPFTNARVSTNGIRSGSHGYPTYMVGSLMAPSWSIQNNVVGLNSFLGYPSAAKPMAIYKNGNFVGFRYQPGTQLK